MSRAETRYTGVGVELIRRLSAESERVFATERARKLAPELGVSEGYCRELLSKLVASGWLVRLRRGLYAVSSGVPGTTPAHEYEIAMHLVEPAAISHWSAFSYHGLTDQVPRRVYVTTTSDTWVPRERTAAGDTSDGYTVGGTVYKFVQVKPERFFGIERVWVGEARVATTDLERSLLDGLTMPRYCGDFAEVLSAFGRAADRLDLGRIAGYALRLDQATAKRLGWVLEHVGIDDDELDRLLEVSVTGYRTLDASGPRKGPCDGKWMIQENLPGRIDS